MNILSFFIIVLNAETNEKNSVFGGLEMVLFLVTMPKNPPKKEGDAQKEEKILISFEESDKIKAQIDSENLKLKDEERIFLQQKKAVESRIEEIGGRLNQLDAQRKQIIPSIDPKMLQEYERILHSRGGLAIVTVKDNSCGGCHMLVPPQVINLIQMYEHIITCEVCNRILYIKE